MKTDTKTPHLSDKNSKKNKKQSSLIDIGNSEKTIENLITKKLPEELSVSNADSSQKKRRRKRKKKNLQSTLLLKKYQYLKIYL